ncbi:zinc finger protein 64 [Tribolium castaneum]|uniref:Zinc finger protein 142-like Protein n=1 Tax=Tribolium castaneum TaxID=7070 RepID=D2A461_TRICA|nr:PREDICTED: zinc finger protein 64 homolog, isoforms 3 and 4 [Tribolium castaneum]EFA05621.1 Zinc finger protein 142-like Protein [Tribolium castaneum]|eukprot:XP_008195022.1 PREDICTED: zinc finger protein 64 homolog, isoforms 3 and 4 [Tribolium castaneum]
MSIICRTCLQIVDKSTFYYIDTFDNSQISNTVPKDVLQVCVPEMDLYISEQPGICSDCLNMFETFYNFKNKCLASEDKILSYFKRNKLDPQSKVNLSCVVYDVDDNETNKKLAQLETSPEIDIIKLNGAPKPIRAQPDDKEVLLLTCNQCSFATMDKTKLITHKCLPTPCSEKYKCPYCEYSTSRRYRLSYHVNAKHTKTNWYHCTQCEYKTTDSSSLRRHLKVVHVEREGTAVVTCSTCYFTTTSQVALQRHKVAKHGPPMHQCTICSYQTKDKSNFRKHQYVHGDKPKKCTKCSYQCVSPYQLEKHYKRSHV